MVAPVWRKSSYSGLSHCAEVAVLPSPAHPGYVIAVRDSKDPHGPALAFTPGEWTAFLARLKAMK